METLDVPVIFTETLDEKTTRVSSGSTPVQTGLAEESTSSRFIETEISVKEIDKNGIGDVSVVEVSLSRKRGRKKKMSKNEEKDGKSGGGGEKLPKEAEAKKMSGSEGSNGKLELSGDEVKESQIEVEEEEGEDEEDEGEEEEEMGDEEHDFSVGDMVWGKVKSHPWWPGQIYSQSDASATAAKYKRRNRLLVAYFGDGTFAWCYPSQLKPFREKFDQLAKQSNSKSFVKAVAEAVNEVGRRLDLEMACTCLAVEDRPVKPMALNAGIKEGIVVPDDGIGDLSIAQYEPAEFLAHLKDVAQVVSVHNVLDLLILERRLSAFYRAKGYNKLPKYHEPMTVLAPDKTAGNGITHEDNVGGQTADLTGSPVEADWLSLEAGPGVGSTGITISRRRPGISGYKLLQSKKQRSMSEILGGDTNVKDDETCEGSLTEEGTMSEKASVLPKKRKENMGSEVGDDSFVAEELANSGKQTTASRTRKKNKDGKTGGDDHVTEEGTLSNKTTVTPRKRRKKGSEEGNNDEISEENKNKVSKLKNTKDVAEKLIVSGKQTMGPRTIKKIQESKAGNDNGVATEPSLSGKQTVSSRKRKNKDSEVDNEKVVTEELTPSGKETPESRKRKESTDSQLGNGNGIVEGSSDSKLDSLSKMSKNTKLTEPSVVGENKASNVKNDEFGTNFIVKEPSTDGKQGFKIPKKTTLTGPFVKGENKASNIENDDLVTNDGSKSGLSLRERKKSKYLSPPYTNISQGKKNVMSTNDSKKENPSIPIISHEQESVTREAGQSTFQLPIVKCSGALDTELSKGSCPVANTSGGSSPLKPNESDEKSVCEEGNASAHEMLSEFRSAALNPLNLTKKQSDDTIKGFFTKFRSSLRQNGSDFTTDNKYLASRGAIKRVSFDTELDSSEKVSYETGHPLSEGDSEKKKRKKKEGVMRSPKHAGSKREDNEENSVAALLLTFAPGASLPSKDELLATFSSFGALNESQTEVIEDSGCAQVVFASSSDAEEAYRKSEKISSFRSSPVSYRLRYLLATSRASQNARNSPQHLHSIPSTVNGGDNPLVQSTSLSQVGGVPSLPLVRQHLEMATSILERSWDKLSAGVKANLDAEIKGLLNKVSSMVESSSS